MNWYERCYSRLLIDNHITEDDPSYMTKFDPATYVRMVKRAGVDSAMVYACCHNGNCYYPTKVGHMHANLAGRDIFGETVDLLKAEGIVPIAYYTAVFHNDSAKLHPGWRSEDICGNQNTGRYWFSCPNSREYREFTKAQISEVIGYDVDGIFIDMTFWPWVCTCSNCRERFLNEAGLEIPLKIDWNNEEWTRFQRARERWLAEYAHELTDHIKAVRPEITVTHQFAPVLLGWSFGQSPDIAEACDYAGGDFYGGRYQQSLGTKVFAAFSKNIPYEFMTSRCVNLYDHTTMKSEDDMFCHVAMTLANGGAYFFIDAINPDGTLSEDVYDRLHNVVENARPFKDMVQSHRPVLEADIGLYFSMASHMDERHNGIDLRSMASGQSNMSTGIELPALKELVGTSYVLSRANIPYRIVRSDNLDLQGLRAIIINNAAFMSDGEVNALREFVRGGGTVIATGRTSLYDISGETTGEFKLSDVFGVSYSGRNSGRISYLSYRGDVDNLPSEGGDRMQHILSDIPSPLVKSIGAEVLANVTGTYTDPDDIEHYASIHSNPPGTDTGFHGLTVNQFGDGRCVYLYSSLLAMQNHAHQTFGAELFKKYAPSGLIVDSNAPACVETTVLRSTTRDAFLLCMVNYQIELPNVPVRDLTTTLYLGNKRPASCRRASNGELVDFGFDNGLIEILVPEIQTIEIIEIKMS